MSFNPLEIIYESGPLIAINKPHGLLVHRSKIAKDVDEFALQLLRDQIDHKVFLAHRLDRKTSGVLLFTKDRESNGIIQKLFRDRETSKKYIAIVRGWVEDCEIDTPLTVEDKTQDAFTKLKTLNQFEVNIPLGKYPSSRYSLVELTPLTGRFHQLRKHMNHLRHPILGDRPHGCSKQNRLWKNKFDMTEMMLHAKELSFQFEGKDICIKAKESDTFEKVMHILNTYPTNNSVL